MKTRHVRTLDRVDVRVYVQSMSTQTLSATMTRIDKGVRAMHAERVGHTAEGYWTDPAQKGGMMYPRQFVTTCCDDR